jgi:hypothetical protein
LYRGFTGLLGSEEGAGLEGATVLQSSHSRATVGPVFQACTNARVASGAANVFGSKIAV